MGATGPSGGFDLQNFFKGSQYAPPQQQGQFQPVAAPPQPELNQSIKQSPGSQTFTSTNSTFPSSFNSSSPSMYPNYQQFQQDQQNAGRPPPYPNLSMSTAPPFASYSQPPPQPTLRTSQAAAATSQPTSGTASPTEAGGTPLDGARLMALLTTHSVTEGVGKEDDLLSMNSPDGSGLLKTIPPGPGKVSSKVPRGRALKGDRFLYDVDAQNPAETQPQLEVHPITVYGSDPVPIPGSQIAVNHNYICYGLRYATIRILNTNTALKALLRGHTDRISDMAFLNENSNLLASASTDGRVIVRNIVEARAADDKILIQESILVALQFVGDWVTPQQPRLCWHSYVKDLLVVAIDKYVVTLDLSRVRGASPPGGFTIEQPSLCMMDNPLEGVNIVGIHHEIVSDLAVLHYSSTRIISSSYDGTVQVWGEQTRSPVSTFTPHQGKPVGAIALLSAPRHPEHFLLLTAGPLNRELKLWAPEEKSQSRSTSQKWLCLQTLEFDSTHARGKVESAFFNQVLIALQGSIILVANAKRNAIYAIHVDFGSSPLSARMDYISEFSVTMPILSLTIMEDAVSDGGEIHLYCVQTQSIQQYILPIDQCQPPERVALEYEQSNGSDSLGETSVETSVANKSNQAPSSSQAQNLTHSKVDHHNLLRFGDLLDEASSHHDLRTVPIDVPKQAPESRKPIYQTTKVTQTVADRAIQTSTVSAIQHVPLPENVDSGPPPKINTERGLPARPKDQWVAPVKTSQRLQADKLNNSAESRGRFSNTTAPEKMDLSSESWRFNSVSPGLSRQVDDARDNSQAMPVSSESARLAVGKADSSAENRSDSISTRARVLDSTESETLSNTPVDDSLEKEGGNSNQVSIQKQTGPIPTHLITPRELMSLAAGTKVDYEPESKWTEETTREPSFSAKALIIEDPKRDGALDRSAASDVSEMRSTMDFQDKIDALGTGDFEHHSTTEAHETEEDGVVERNVMLPGEEIQEQFRDMVLGAGAGENTGAPPSWTQSKTKKNKNKTSGVSGGGGLPPLPHVVGGTHSSQAGSADGEPNSGLADLAAQLSAMQETINNMISTQSELQKQITILISVPVGKEGKRLEGALGQRMEKVLKAQVEAMWARMAEESAKREKVEREHVQQINTLVGNLISKDMPSALERGVKKEFGALGPTVTQAVLPPLQKAIFTAVTEIFQKGISEKVVPQLEKVMVSKLEATLGRQLQVHFQTTGKQALQETLRTCLETSLLPNFEHSVQEMFNHMDSSFQQGMADHTAKAQQQFTSSHSALASTLKEVVTDASRLANILKVELAESHKKILAYVENQGVTAAALVAPQGQSNRALPDKVLSLQSLVESLDPTVKLSKLVGEGKLEESFTMALSLSDVTIVSWLCDQMDPHLLFGTSPLPLSQGVLLSLVQQLGCHLNMDTANKLTWIREAALALNVTDPGLAPHMRNILQQLYQNLHTQMAITPSTGELMSALRLVIHVVNSLLTSCK